MATNAPVDVKELNGSYIFVVDVPGLRITDIKVPHLHSFNFLFFTVKTCSMWFFCLFPISY